MPRCKAIIGVAAVSGLLSYGSIARAEVIIETVTVGNPGNPGENSGESEPGGYGPDRICGAVDHVHNIGKFEVTASQYTEFLNAVAAEDSYGLYHTGMADPTGPPPSGLWGCNIQRSGSPGSYSYSVAVAWGDRPVNYVDWGDAARFCNWLHNGQPTGPQDITTTEDGSYYLNGATSDAELMAVTRQEDATWVIPSEDEWYKAAYHHNDGVTANYYDYPTRSDNVPVCECCPGGSSSANWDCNGNDPGGYACGDPYFRNIVGCYVDSSSSYDTFDQGSNVWEWNEAVILGAGGVPYRGLRGGSFDGSTDGGMLAAYRNFTDPLSEDYYTGFRVAQIPGDIPTVSTWGSVAMTLLVLTAGTLVYARRRPMSA